MNMELAGAQFMFRVGFCRLLLREVHLAEDHPECGFHSRRLLLLPALERQGGAERHRLARHRGGWSEPAKQQLMSMYRDRRLS